MTFARLGTALLVAVLLCSCKKGGEQVTGANADPSTATAPLESPENTPDEVPKHQPFPLTLPDLLAKAAGKDPTDGPQGTATLPEASPHPRYPTQRAAGTEQIFYMEEPPRGPWVTSVTLPEGGSLTWSEHRHCEIDLHHVACSKAARVAGQRYWQVGRRNGRLVLAQKRLPSGQLVDAVLFTYDDKGRVARTHDLDPQAAVESVRSFQADKGRYSRRAREGSNPLPGCGYMAYKADARGRVRETRCLQWTGEPMLDTAGIATVRYDYDELGFETRRALFGGEGSPATNNQGIHAYVYERDEHGRVAGQRHLGVDGEPTAAVNDGCFRRRFTRNAVGSQADKTCLDAKGAILVFEKKVSKWVYQTDAQGCRTGLRYQSADGWPRSWRHGIYGERYTVDAACRRLTRTCLGREGKPIACGPRAPATYAYELDARGWTVMLQHFDAEEKATVSSSCKAHAHATTYDEHGRVIGRHHFDVAGMPVECSGTGFHGWTTKVDDAGRRTEQRFIAVDGSVTDNMGTVIRRYQYDNYDHRVALHELDANGDPLLVNGYAIRRLVYDKQHRWFGTLLLDHKGEPTHYTACFTSLDCPGPPWHAIRVVRNEHGRATRNLFFDRNAQLIATHDCEKKRCWTK